MEEATFRLRTVLPPAFWVSTKTVHRAEVNASPDPILAAGLARVYEKAPDDWPVELRDALDSLRKVLDPSVTRLLLESAGRTDLALSA